MLLQLRDAGIAISIDDFGTIADLPDTTTRILRIPAPLLCYWMGATELPGAAG